MAQDYMRRAYKAAEAMEPIALPDDYVKIKIQTKTLYRKVTWYEAIPPFQWIDVGAIAAATAAQKANVTNLDLYADEFGQWRWFPLDNIQVRLFLPSGQSKWQLKNIQVGLDRSIIYRDPLLVSTEFNSWEDNRPAVECVNFSGYAALASRIIGWGYRYHCADVFDDSPTKSASILQQLQAGALPATPIICHGLLGQATRV